MFDNVDILTLVHHHWRINFASGQVDFRVTCMDGQVEMFEKKLMICWLSRWITLFAVLGQDPGQAIGLFSI